MSLLVELYRNKSQMIESRINFSCDECNKTVVIYPPETASEEQVMNYVAKNLPVGWSFKDEISFCFGCTCNHDLQGEMLNGETPQD